MRWLLIAVALGGILLAGCSQAEAERQAVVDQSKAILFKVADAAKIDTSSLQAGGVLKNPQYVYEWFGGTGVYSRGSVQVVGVEINADVRGSGTGQATVDADLRERIYQVLQRKEINAEARKQLILETITEWLKSKAATTATGQQTVSAADAKTAEVTVAAAVAAVETQPATTATAPAATVDGASGSAVVKIVDEPKSTATEPAP